MTSIIDVTTDVTGGKLRLQAELLPDDPSLNANLHAVFHAHAEQTFKEPGDRELVTKFIALNFEDLRNLNVTFIPDQNQEKGD